MNHYTNKKGAGFSWLLKMAWRDGRASARKLALFMTSIVLGIAAVVSIQSFSDNLRDNINHQSKTLMGADFIIDSHQPPNKKVQRIIDSLGGYDARGIDFTSMATFPKTGATKLVEVRGMEGNFPLYGKLETEPAGAATSYQEAGAALVDATVMVQFGIGPGDSIKVGELVFPIAGKLVSVPGRTGISTTIAPPVFIPHRFLESTGLLQRGSRLEYEYYFFAKPGMDLKKMDENLDPVLDAEGADLDTHGSTGRRMGENYENFGRFLNLVAFIALLLGCIGIASSIQIYIKEKRSSIAVLRCVGSTRQQTFFIFLIQITGMGLIGALIGTGIGVLLQQLFPLYLQGFFPLDVQVSLSWEAIALGILLGVSMSVLFSLLPLLSIRNISPLQALRISDEPGAGSKRMTRLVFPGILACIFLFSLWLLNDWRYALGFIAGILVTFSIQAGIAALLMKAVKKHFPRSWGFVPRQSLLNLFRPNNQTMTLVLTIGIGTFLISTLYFTKDMLLEKVNFDTTKKGSNLVVFDVQTGQKEAVAGAIAQEGLPVVEHIPIVTMRVHSINGRPANEIREDTTSKIDRWILHHEFRVTYRDTLKASETISAGKWRGTASPDKTVYISVSDNFAENALVEVGDELTFNVQGVLMNTVVGSIREVDWQQVQMNFNVLFPAGILEKAPQFHVLTTHVPDNKASAEIQQKLVRLFPNVSIIDLRQMLTLVEDILNKISWVISFMAFFSILTGIIVLIGAVKTSKYQRIRESVLLRTIGARSKQILNITALEYFYLALLGCTTGVSLSLISSSLLGWLAFDAVFSPSWIPFLVLVPGVTILVVAIGLSNSRSAVSSPPLQVLRKETL